MKILSIPILFMIDKKMEKLGDASQFTLEWLLICNSTFAQRKLPPESEMKGLAFIKARFLNFTSFF